MFLNILSVSKTFCQERDCENSHVFQKCVQSVSVKMTHTRV